MSEPSLEVLGGTGPGRVTKRLLLATRPPFFTASVLPVLLGSAWGHRESGAFNADAFVVAMIAVICAHGATNVLNDVYDDLSGVDVGNDDRLHPFTGGSRFIQNGVMTRGEMARWGAFLAVFSMLAGLVLVALKGVAIVVFGVIGLALGVLYSMPPAKLSARGLGELAVGLGLGVLPVCGAAWLQAGTITPATVLLSLPVAAWVANILVINEVPDIRADALAGKRTLVVRLGAGGTRVLYVGLHLFAALAVALAVALGVLPALSLVLPAAIALGSPFIARAIIRPPDSARLLPGIRMTLAAHAVGTLWLLGWVLGG